MKRAASTGQAPAPTDLPSESSWPEDLFLDFSDEETQSEPVLSNHTSLDPSMLMDAEFNELSISTGEHTAPGKSDRSTSASSGAASAKIGDVCATLKEAARSGDAESQFRLGDYYYSRQEVEENKEQAFIWYRMAAGQGHAAAQFNVGVMYKNGEGVEVDKEKAFKWFQEAAEQGDSEAQFKLALMYGNGEGVEKNNEKAFKWFQEAAKQGHPMAQVILGDMYVNGHGVDVNKGEAFEWFKKVAAQGVAEAQFTLGVAHAEGVGVKANNEKAFEWFCKAAEQGHDKAQRRVSECYQKGMGVTKDLPLAAYWILKSLHSKIYTSSVVSLDRHSELIKLFPSILENYSEFKDMHTIYFYSDEEFFGDEEIAVIAGFIRSNSKITDLEITYPATDMSNVHFSALVEALKVNTQLSDLEFIDGELSEEMNDQIEVLLTQNRDIAELRQYVEDLKIRMTHGFPLDIVKIMVDKMIVAYLKSGQTKEATKNAIDEMLIIADMKVLGEDTKIT